jgi:hypothetical protein
MSNKVFDMLGLPDEADVKPTPTFKPQAKLKISAQQMAKAARDIKLMAMHPEHRIVYVKMAYAEGESFEGCESKGCQLGIWVDPRVRGGMREGHARVCLRCEGAITIDAKKTASNNTYDMSGVTGTRKGHWEQYHSYNHYN